MFQVFQPSVDNAIGSLNKAINKLDAAADYHEDQANNHASLEEIHYREKLFHEQETDRAMKIRINISKLLEV